MTNNQLTQLLALVQKKTKGKKGPRVYGSRIAACRPWVRRHQPLIRKALREPDGVVDVRSLIPDTADVEELLELGFIHFDDINTDDLIWSHAFGDDHGIKVLVGLIDGKGEHDAATKRNDEMVHAMTRGRR